MKKAGFKVTDICRNLKLQRSGYYRRSVQKPIDAEEVMLKAKVQQIHHEMHATYGSRRMCAELNAQGYLLGRYKVRRVMKNLSLKAKRPKQHRYPTIGQVSSIAPNTLNRQFKPAQSNSHWTGDITYIRTSQGWLYLAIVLDLYSRRVVGWAFSGQPNSELSTRALQLAVQHRRPEQPLLFHTDQGVQYSSEQFQRSLRTHGMTASMSRRGNCLDNAVTERFFRSLKTERVNTRQYKTRQEAMEDIADYIEPFYNRIRRHSTLGNLSPAAYEEKHQNPS
ncbi:MAG: transposase [Betaproteobacteria bacterium HGW-Betaproteobacteria-22]|nr:MAG: transposase [Betaproteobacteria bacterium HGW-Betaproteobacteria-22]